uniref:Uncharacterized protein n=1 Tax=Anguilla anguilla TaxID=7936 RepID=A0A0E9WT74_ANGAN
MHFQQSFCPNQTCVNKSQKRLENKYNRSKVKNILHEGSTEAVPTSLQTGTKRNWPVSVLIFFKIGCKHSVLVEVQPKCIPV